MKLGRITVVLALAATAALVTTACGGPQAHVQVVNPVGSDARGIARVSVRAVEGNVFKFTVANLSTASISVNRDAVVLRVQGETRMREAGGAAHSYTILGGSAHDVNVKFAIADLPEGTPVTVSFEDALTSGGVPVPVPPLEFVVN